MDPRMRSTKAAFVGVLGGSGRLRHARTALLTLIALAALAGCTAQGAGSSNFDLKPARVGWYAGDEATFTLAITSSLLHGQPSFTIDRRFAIERLDLTEQGIKFGGDYETKDPDAVNLTLSRDGNATDELTLDKEHPSLDVSVTLPDDLRDSEYALELKLFKVGWVKSEKFRVDRR
jgi:hypothetical protein